VRPALHCPKGAAMRHLAARRGVALRPISFAWHLAGLAASSVAAAATDAVGHNDPPALHGSPQAKPARLLDDKEEDEPETHSDAMEAIGYHVLKIKPRWMCHRKP